MKKLLVLAAVIVATVAANAATFKWTAGNIPGTDNTGKLASGTEATLWAVLLDQGVQTGSPIEVTTKALTAAGTINYASIASDAISSANGELYDFYFTVESDGKLFTSTVKSGIGVQATATTVLAFGTQASQSWAAVPEPTSGLLLLLGMAGLALKRKRA